MINSHLLSYEVLLQVSVLGLVIFNDLEMVERMKYTDGTKTKRNHI